MKYIVCIRDAYRTEFYEVHAEDYRMAKHKALFRHSDYLKQEIDETGNWDEVFQEAQKLFHGSLSVDCSKKQAIIKIK